MAKKCFLGLDLGGTYIKAGVVDEDANILSKVSVDTEREGGVDVVISRMCRAGELAIEEAGLVKKDIDAIGIGSPGTLNHKKGIVIAPPNLPDWRDVPLRDRISEYFSIPTTLENDANAAAWGEFWAGAGKEVNSLVMLTLGTGIGGGIIIDGKIHRGAHDVAAEIGHMIINYEGRPCACGQVGCVEAYASAMNMAKIAEERLKAGEGKDSALRGLLENGELIDSKIIQEYMVRGDEFAEEIWDQTCKYLAVISVSLANLIDPEMIVYAGGMAKAGSVLIDRIRYHFNKIRSEAFREARTKLVLAQLGADAGVVGAAGAAKLARDSGEI